MSDPDPSEDGPLFAFSDDVVETTYDWSSVSPSTAVVETVAVAADAEPTALDPLYERIDTDALDSLVDPATSGREVTVSFTFAGHDVVIVSDGTVAVRKVDTDVPPE